jgi:hypothetical protein
VHPHSSSATERRPFEIRALFKVSEAIVTLGTLKKSLFDDDDNNNNHNDLVFIILFMRLLLLLLLFKPLLLMRAG